MSSKVTPGETKGRSSIVIDIFLRFISLCSLFVREMFYLLSFEEQFGTVFEVHRIVMPPSAAPDKTVFFKRIYDDLGNGT